MCRSFVRFSQGDLIGTNFFKRSRKSLRVACYFRSGSVSEKFAFARDCQLDNHGDQRCDNCKDYSDKKENFLELAFCVVPSSSFTAPPKDRVAQEPVADQGKHANEYSNNC